MMLYRVARLWWRITRPVTLGVRVVALDAEGKVVLVRHTYGPQLWFLPGGGVKRGESFRQAAGRELDEEVGVRVAPGDLEVLRVDFSRAEYKNDHIVTFVVHMGVVEPRRRGPEIREVMVVDPMNPPEDLSPATARRLAEITGASEPTPHW